MKPLRTNMSFGPDAAYAAALVSNDTGAYDLESWSFATGVPQARRLPTRAGEKSAVQVVPTGDGGVAFVRNGPGHHEVGTVTAAGVEQLLAHVDMAGLRLVPTPERGVLAVAIGMDSAGTTSFWRVVADTPYLVPAAKLPMVVSGGHWLDLAGRLFSVNSIADGRGVPIAVDLGTGTVHTLPRLAGSRSDHVIMTDPRRGGMLLVGDADQAPKLAWADRDDPVAHELPDRFDTSHGSVEPLAIDPTGTRIAMRVDRGVRSGVAVYHRDDHRVNEIPVPGGQVIGGAGWHPLGLHVVVSTPARPAAPGTVLPGPHRIDESDVDVDVVTVDGAAGPMEAVVYGGPHWWRREQLIVALHGGPESRWRLEYHPLFGELAAAGAAIVAPNQRGSTGYGAAHRDAIHGAWGGPDLADIRRLAADLTARRTAHGLGPLVLYGASYGAYLALLVAACDPELWSRCAVVAPFLSGSRLHADAGPTVRALVDRLGGRQAIDDEIGDRDVLRLCDRIIARLLILHGVLDEVVPIGQSRALRDKLRRAGADFEYVEVSGGNHDFLGAPAVSGLRRRFTRFLTSPIDERG